MADNKQFSASEQRFQQYFTALAPVYGSSTGNTTRDLLLKYFEEHGKLLDITESSNILDNASGPGTATEALLKWTNKPLHITATDFVPAMIEATDRIKNNNDTWVNVTTQVTDSQHLPFADQTFDFDVINFSIFTFDKPSEALKEAYRTLKPEGTLIVTTWKQNFLVFDIMLAAQKIVKGDDFKDALKPAGEEFFQEGYLANMVRDAGWVEDAIKVSSISHTINDPADEQGLFQFMTGPFSKMARAGWNEEENAKWSRAVEEAITNEKTQNSGLCMNAWVVVATR